MRPLLALMPVLPLVLFAAPARADSIDGAWCHEKGRRMVISGPAITTPAGTPAQGDYGRHDFAYTVPPGEPGAGMRVRMVLMGEWRVRVQEGDAAPEIWERCGPSVS